MAAPRTALTPSFGAVTDLLLRVQPDRLFLLVFTLALCALSAGRPVLGGALLGILAWPDDEQRRFMAPYLLLALALVVHQIRSHGAGEPGTTLVPARSVATLDSDAWR